MEKIIKLKQKRTILAGCKYFLQENLNLYPSGCPFKSCYPSIMAYLGICPASVPDVYTASGSSSNINGEHPDLNIHGQINSVLSLKIWITHHLPQILRR